MKLDFIDSGQSLPLTGNGRLAGIWIRLIEKKIGRIHKTGQWFLAVFFI